MGIPIAPASLMFRALQRYRRTFHTEDLVERVTDTVIALETLTAPAMQTEINYRVAQRVSFLNSDDPQERLRIAKQVKKAYGIRSSQVHSGTGESEATEEFADECREFLRVVIRQILETKDNLRSEFCEFRKDHGTKHTFFDALISFGNPKEASEYWQKSKSKPAEDSATRKRNPKS